MVKRKRGRPVKGRKQGRPLGSKSGYDVSSAVVCQRQGNNLKMHGRLGVLDELSSCASCEVRDVCPSRVEAESNPKACPLYLRYLKSVTDTLENPIMKLSKLVADLEVRSFKQGLLDKSDVLGEDGNVKPKEVLSEDAERIIKLMMKASELRLKAEVAMEKRRNPKRVVDVGTDFLDGAVIEADFEELVKRGDE